MSAPARPGRTAALCRAARAFFLLDEGRGRNAAMEGLRGYAVLLTFLVHAAGDSLTTRGVPWEQFAPRPLTEAWGRCHAVDVVLLFLQRSHYGVDLFFLLSGFLIARLVASPRRPFSYRDFLWKRWLRLYPAFFLALAAATWVQTEYLQWSPFRGREFLKNALLLYGCPGVRVFPYLYVSWTLFNEALFYLTAPALFGLLARVRRDGPWRPAAGVALLAAVFALHAQQPRFAGFFFGALIGMCADETLARAAGRMPGRLVAAAYAAVVVYFYGFAADRTLFLPLLWVVSSALFVKGCFGDGLLNRALRLPPLRLLGNLSYSFYLIHVPALMLTGKWFGPLLGRLHGAARPGAYFGLGFALALVLSAALFAVAERWYFGYVRRGRDRAAPAAPDAAAPVPLARAG